MISDSVIVAGEMHVAIILGYDKIADNRLLLRDTDRRLGDNDRL